MRPPKLKITEKVYKDMFINLACEYFGGSDKEFAQLKKTIDEEDAIYKTSLYEVNPLEGTFYCNGKKITLCHENDIFYLQCGNEEKSYDPLIGHNPNAWSGTFFHKVREEMSEEGRNVFFNDNNAIKLEAGNLYELKVLINFFLDKENKENSDDYVEFKKNKNHILSLLDITDNKYKFYLNNQFYTTKINNFNCLYYFQNFLIKKVQPNP
jgi:hypothetical protein